MNKNSIAYLTRVKATSESDMYILTIKTVVENIKYLTGIDKLHFGVYK